MKLKLVYYSIMLILLLVTGCEKEKVGEIENDIWMDQIMGSWSNKEESDLVLDMQEGIQRIGVKDGQLLSTSEYTITEINHKERSIVIHGFSEEMSYHEDLEKREFASKLVINHNGNELLYIHDYLNEKIESIWIKP